MMKTEQPYFPSRIIKVNLYKLPKVDKDTILNKKVYKCSTRNNQSKIDLSKGGIVVEIIDCPVDHPNKLPRNGYERFWVKLNNGVILPSDRLIIIETTLIDFLKKYKTIPTQINISYPKFKYGKKYFKYYNESFTFDFLFLFFQRLIRDIRIGWDNPPTKEELINEIPKYTGEEWTEKNKNLFDKLYNRFNKLVENQ